MKTIRTFCQTIDRSNHKAVQEKSRHKALQAEFNGGRNRNRGGQSCGHGRNSGRGGGRQPNQTGRGRQKYHNWILKEQFDNLDEEGYQRLIRDHITCGKIHANNSDTNPAPSADPTAAPNPAQAPPSQIQVSGTTAVPEAQSVLTGVPPSVAPLTSQSVSMAMVTPSQSSHGSTTATQMESGPNTLLRQLMSNAPARFTHLQRPHKQTIPLQLLLRGGAEGWGLPDTSNELCLLIHSACITHRISGCPC